MYRRLTVITMSVLGAILLGRVDSSTAGQAAQPLRDYVEIDGAKTPAAIPEWLAWQNALRVLALASDNYKESPTFAHLALSESDRELVIAAAKNQVLLDGTCERQQLGIAERLKGVERSTLKASMRQGEISCRVKTLAAKDELLDRLSQHAVMSLRRFVDESRSTIKVLIHKDNLEHYRRPR